MGTQILGERRKEPQKGAQSLQKAIATLNTDSTTAWFTGKMILKAINTWSQIMTKTLIKTTKPTTSERAR